MQKCLTRYIVREKKMKFEINVHIKLNTDKGYPIISEDVSAIIPVRDKWDVKFKLNDLVKKVHSIVDEMRRSV